MTERVAVFGAGGMLGRAVVEELERRGHHVTPLRHSEGHDISDSHAMAKLLWSFDSAINCVGVRPGGRADEMARANAVGPWVLALAGRDLRHLVHVSTDCVFDGGLYAGPPRRTDNAPAPRDLYGRTKLAGELVGVSNATTVRTSFLGLEHGLLRYLLNGEWEVEGWRHAFWTGSSVWAVARGLCDVLATNPFGGWVEHLSTREKVSKFDVLRGLKLALDRTTVIRAADKPHIDRALEPTIELPPIDYEEVARRVADSRRGG